jgi:hypothetical protein
MNVDERTSSQTMHRLCKMRPDGAHLGNTEEFAHANISAPLEAQDSVALDEQSMADLPLLQKTLSCFFGANSREYSIPRDEKQTPEGLALNLRESLNCAVTLSSSSEIKISRTESLDRAHGPTKRVCSSGAHTCALRAASPLPA